jgi:hypothetical protein
LLCVNVKSAKLGGLAPPWPPITSRSREPMGLGVTPAGSFVNSEAMLRVSVSSETRGTQGGAISRRSSLAQSRPRKKGCALISSAPR